jgi:hypothetical protein
LPKIKKFLIIFLIIKFLNIFILLTNDIVCAAANIPDAAQNEHG